MIHETQMEMKFAFRQPGSGGGMSNIISDCVLLDCRANGNKQSDLPWQRQRVKEQRVAKEIMRQPRSRNESSQTRVIDVWGRVGQNMISTLDKQQAKIMRGRTMPARHPHGAVTADVERLFANRKVAWIAAVVRLTMDASALTVTGPFACQIP